MASPAATAARPTRVHEVRVATVMYGGISLAIYINGVARELFDLVRATAADGDGNPLVATELVGAQRVYRELGQRLGRDGDFGPGPAPDDAPIRTRIVVDALSGASAGGINAVFLAKALANGQRIDGLKDVWTEQGDVELLVNDRASEPSELERTEPPPSLLNGRRMYVELLRALDAMDATDAGTGPGVLVPHGLDLAVTATDVGGLPVPIALADAVVWERKHRHVFELEFRPMDEPGAAADGRNDFTPGANPFLAFIARCTSSIPFVFEPMQLRSAEAMARTAAGDRHGSFDASRWSRFFPEYDPAHVPELAFADGGILDNKPFGHAIDASARRTRSTSVERKLVYVEPSPERLGPATGPLAPPDAIGNALLGLSLPGYETIREDLQRLLDRNRTLERIETLLSGVQEDLEFMARGDPAAAGPLRWPGYAEMFLDDLLDQPGLGAAYGSYHRLKVASVTDDLARFLTTALGLDEASDEVHAVRQLLGIWRKGHFVRYRQQREATATSAGWPRVRASETAFVQQFDLAYRVRRLDFVVQQIDAWWGAVRRGALDDAQVHQATRVARGLSGERAPTPATLLHAAGPVLAELERLRAVAFSHLSVLSRRLGVLRDGWHQPSDPPPWWTTLRGMAAEARDALPTAAPDVRAGPDSMLERVQELDLPADEAGVVRGLGDLGRSLAHIAAYLSEIIAPVSHAAATAVTEATADRPGDPPAVRLVRAVVADAYRMFERHDLVSFPILRATEVGEERIRVDVHRISPEDATTIVDEHRERRTKLAGTRYGHFGAFFERSWRELDILWGRLDGAERLITMLVPADVPLSERRRLIDAAQEGILEEEYASWGERLARPRTKRRGRVPELMDQVDRAVSRTAGRDPFTDLRRRVMFDRTSAERLGQAITALDEGLELLDEAAARGGP